MAGVHHQVLQRHHWNRAAGLLPDFWHHSCRRHHVVLSFSAVCVGFYNFRRSYNSLWGYQKMLYGCQSVEPISTVLQFFYIGRHFIVIYAFLWTCLKCLVVRCSGKYSVRLQHLRTTLSWLPFVKYWWLSFTRLQKNPHNHPLERGLLCFCMRVYGSLALSKCLSEWVSVCWEEC